MQAIALEPALMRRAGFQRDQQHHQISEIARQVIPEQRVIRDVEELNHEDAATLVSGARLETSSQISELDCKMFRRRAVSAAGSAQFCSSASSVASTFAFSTAVR